MKKAVRASKRLVMAIIGFVLSLALCLGMCLAWFAISEEVDSKGAAIRMDDEDFVCEVNAYYLDNTDAENVYVKGKGNVTVGAEVLEVDDGNDGELSSDKDKMRPYGSVENFATAVLYEVKYTIKRESGTYRIAATCDSDTISVTRKPDAVDVFDSDLSNVVGYYQAGANSNAENRFKRSDDHSAIMFYKVDNTKEQKLELEGGIGYNGGKEVVAYFIMDYMDFPFVKLSNEMVQHEGTLNSRLDFAGDLHIVFERDDGECTTFGHTHDYKYASVGALQHRKYCECGLYETYENHTFAAGSGECTYCHYKSEHVHKFENNNYVDNGNGTHSLQCDLCDFKQDTQTAHSYEYESIADNLEQHIKKCSVCNYSENEAHSLTYTDTNDGTHHTVGCENCDLSASEEHSPSNDSCDKCGRGQKIVILFQDGVNYLNGSTLESSIPANLGITIDLGSKHSTKQESYSYNGTTYKNGVKIESATQITITSSTNKKLTLCYYDYSNRSEAPGIKVDGAVQTGGNGKSDNGGTYYLVTIDLTANKAITLGRTDYEVTLCYLIFESA